MPPLKTVLILSYYFPPMGLGGVQRIQKFVKYLPQYGWRPIVVTVKDVRYYGRDESLLEEIPPEAVVYRTGSYDPLRIAHRLGMKKDVSRGAENTRKIARWLLFPDNQVAWVPFAVQCARDIIRKYPVDAIFSSFPPASAHVAGYILNATTGIPWVADFRDSWSGGEFGHQPSVMHDRWMERLGRRICRRANQLIGVTDHISDQLSTMGGDRSRVDVITNGYDPDDFVGLNSAVSNDRFTLTYCGTLNPSRHPEPLLKALRFLLDRNPSLTKKIHVKLVGASIGLDLDGLIAYYRLQNIVTNLGYLPHREALAHLAGSDALLMFITSKPDRAAGVPTGKFYEYLATGRPILGITPDNSALSWLETSGRGVTATPGDTTGISRIIKAWIARYDQGTVPEINQDGVAEYSRLRLTERLARILNHVCTI